MFCRKIKHYHELNIDSDTLVLTANQRLALHLQRQHDQHQISLGQTAWQTPPILPLLTWFEQLWRQHQNTKRLLTPIQTQLLWQHIIQADATQWQINAEAVAKQVASAYQMLRNWRIPLDALCNHNEEADLLFHWCQNFVTTCDNNQWLCAADLLPDLITYHQAWQTSLPKQIFLFGFDELPPLMEYCFQLIETTCSCERVTLGEAASQLSQIRCYDQQAEINAMLQFAKQHHDNNPTARIGCVVLNLEQIRDHIDFAFHCMRKPNNMTYNISAALPLSNYPIIAQALNLLRLGLGSIDVNHFAAVAQSPYTNQNSEDIELGATLDALLRENNQLNLPLTGLFPLLQTCQLHFPTSTWTKRWHLFCQQQKKLPAQASAAQWAEHFQSLLETYGWPGNEGLNSLEYQVLQRWRQLLADFSQIDLLLSTLDYAQALHYLQQQCQTTPFQAEGSIAPIQILGTLEAAGNQFDYLWIMGMDDEHWPPAAKPNPFIPISLQRHYQLPHASALREYQYAQATQQRLFESATTIMVSSACYAGDKRLQASRLIADIHTIEQPETYGTAQNESMPDKHELESLEDINGPPIDHNIPQRGGTQIIKLQALCPFKAFATLRLNATPLQQPKLQLAPSEKGIIAHKALQNIWLKLQNQQRLKAASETELTTLIDNAINNALQLQPQQQIHSTQHFFLHTEKKRLQKLLSQWLALEKQRPYFAVVAREHAENITINNIDIRIQVDRIDATDSGHVIIDYKTGENSPQLWFGERIIEPQLPLYCTFFNGHDDYAFRGICFAELRSQSIKYKGILAESCESWGTPFKKDVFLIDQYRHPEQIESWQEQTHHWRINIKKLCLEFSNGNAAVQPYQASLTCQYCDLQSLCRINHHD